MNSPFRVWRRVALWLLVVVLPAQAIQPDDLLPPEQAFALQVRAAGPERLVAEWTVAEGYYLYRERTRFESATPGIELGEPQFAAGRPKTDEFFGDMEVYYGLARVEIPLSRDPDAPQRIELSTVTQGCAEIGVCYPPQEQTVSVDLPPLTVLAQSGPASGGRVDPDRVDPDRVDPDRVDPDRVDPDRVDPLGGLDLSVPLGQSRPAISKPAPAGLPDDELPDPQLAFPVELSVVDGDTLRASWGIAGCCYLYREQFAFESLAPGVQLGAPRFPTGTMIEDEFFGRTEVYRDAVVIDIPMQRGAGAGDELSVRARFQGCADIGVCYPPQERTLTVSLAGLPPAATGVAAIPPANPLPDTVPSSTAPPLSEQDAIARMLTEQRFWALPAFFGFGLLLAFTPCVFPMIPILSGIIAGHGNSLTRTRAFLLSLVYVLAMALTYTAAGVGAALAGQNVQVWFQNPWVLSVFAGLFVLLALAMFGLFTLQLPSALQTRLTRLGDRRGGSYAGVALMGLLSALIVGPCVAPPLIGALTVIGLTGDATLGGSALFAMSLGMGVPLLAVGTSAGHWLPRAGPWMETIKAVFGVLLLAVAIWLLERILPEVISMLLWAVLLIVCAVYMGALKPVEGGWRTLARGLGVVLLVYGVLLLVGVAAGGRDVWQPLRGVLVADSGPAQTQPEFRLIKTVDDLDRQLAAAGNRPVMLDFYADWCVSCKEMEKYTFSDPAVQARMEQAVLLKADVTANDAADRALLQRFDLIGPPAILFFDAGGIERTAYRVVGYMPAERFSAHLDRVLSLSLAMK